MKRDRDPSRGAVARGRRPLAGVLLLVGLVVATAPVSAQVGPPKLLIPRAGDSPQSREPAPRPDAPATEPAPGGAAPSDPAAVPAPEQPRAPSGIQVDSLAGVSPDYAGPLDPAQGGLPAEMWAGTPRAAIAGLLGLLPEVPANRALRDLQRRLLLTNALLPEVPDPSGGILRARVDRLAAMGDADGLRRLLDLVPQERRGEAIDLVAADQFLAVDEVDRACLLADRHLARSNLRDWQKIVTFCQQRAGEIEKVEFGIRLLQELGDDDTRFFTLASAIAEGGGRADIGGDGEPLDGLDLAMIRAAGVAVPYPEGPQPGAVLASYIDLPGLSHGERLELAEQAESLGLIRTDRLVALYDDIEVRADMLESALSVAERDPSPHGRALLYRATVAQSSPLARAQGVQRGLALARRDGRFGQAARLYAPLIVTLTPSSGFGWFAADAARALHVSGRHEAARPWRELARAEAGRSAEAQSAWLGLWPVARLAAGESAVPWDTDTLDAWWQSVRADDPDAAIDRAGTLFALLVAVGEPVGDALWRDLARSAGRRDVAMPPAPLLFALESAGRGQRVAETAALALATLGGSVADLPVHTIAEALTALVAAGLEPEARRIAVEVALARGL